jgi:hypothetical protein
MALNNSARP